MGVGAMAWREGGGSSGCGPSKQAGVHLHTDLCSIGSSRNALTDPAAAAVDQEGLQGRGWGRGWGSMSAGGGGSGRRRFKSGGAAAGALVGVGPCSQRCRAWDRLVHAASAGLGPRAPPPRPLKCSSQAGASPQGADARFGAGKAPRRAIRGEQHPSVRAPAPPPRSPRSATRSLLRAAAGARRQEQGDRVR